EAGEHPGAEPDLALSIGAVDARCGEPGGDSHQVVQPHQAAGPGLTALTRDEESRDRAEITPVLLAEPELHEIVLVDAGVAEARHLRVAAHHEAQGGRDLLGIDPKISRSLTVDADAELRPVEPQRGVGVRDTAQRDGPGAQLFREARERLEVGTPEDEVDVEAAAPDIEPGNIAHEDPEVAKLPELEAHLLHDLALTVVPPEGPTGVALERLAPEPRQSERPVLMGPYAHVDIALADSSKKAAARIDENLLHPRHRADLVADRPD